VPGVPGIVSGIRELDDLPLSPPTRNLLAARGGREGRPMMDGGRPVFQAAAKAADLSPTSTAADVKKGLYDLKNETLGGLAPPLNFTPGKPAFANCYFTFKVENGQYVSLNNGHSNCVTGDALTKLKQIGQA
jgi:hypothetical protein